jgi:hypothetical protein
VSGELDKNTELPHELYEYTIAVYTGYTLEYIREKMNYKDYEVFSRLSMINFVSDSTIKSVSAGISGGMLGSLTTGTKKHGRKRKSYIPTAEEMKKDNNNPNVAYARKGARK